MKVKGKILLPIWDINKMYDSKFNKIKSILASANSTQDRINKLE
jgi:hypothetical protein